MHLGCKAWVGGPTRTIFGDGQYSGNIIQGGSVLQPDANGVITVTGAATVTPDALTFACVVKGRTLVLDGASALLKPSANCKGLYLHLTGDLILLNGATLNIDGLGKGGTVTGNKSEADVLPESMRKGLALGLLGGYAIKQPGASGGAGGPGSGSSYNQGTVGGTGSAASGMQTGGGGGGGSGKYSYTLRAGNGGPGTAFGGGGGGGGGTRHFSGGTVGRDADAACAGGQGGDQTIGNGGPGGGGAGDPVGQSGWTSGSRYGVSPGTGGPGGILMAFVKGLVSIASGCRISADGMAGGQAYTVYYGAGPGGGGGGGAGGGLVALFWRGGYTNSGTVRANGGAGGGGGGAEGGYAGGPGGFGGIVTLQI